MLNVVVILLTLFTCIDGEANMANALLPLARTDVLDSLSNSSMMVERLIADPKLFVSQMASADPGVIRNVIGMLQLLVQTGTTAINKFERDVTVAKDDKDAKIIIHDDLGSLVESLTEREEDLVAQTGVVTATLVTKTEEKRVAGLDRTAAVTHHTSMVAERDANVPDLTSENTAISSAVSLLQGLLPEAKEVKVKILVLADEWLNLAEVQAYDENQILLQPLRVSLSGPYDENNVQSYAASFCTDGDFDNMCHTPPGGYLVLNYDKDVSIGSLVITNRRGCCKERIVGAIVSITTNNVVSWSHTITDIQDVYSLSI